MNTTWHKKQSFRITAVVLLLAVFLLIKDFNPSGRLEVNYDFGAESPYISRLSPDGRVLEITETVEGERYQPMVIEPVYFDVRLPQNYDNARVEVLYQKDTKTPFQLGFRTRASDWSWYLSDVTPIAQVGEWRRGEAVYDIRDARIDDQNLRFILASPGLSESGEEIQFHHIKMVFEKDKLTTANLAERVRDYLRTYK